MKSGVLAFGDSITNGGGELQWGVALQSWAMWMARGLGLPYSGYAIDGGTIDSVRDVEIPRFLRTPEAEARFDVGCLYIGVNDVRSVDWDESYFEPRYREALEFVASRCERTLTSTIPLDLGRPRAGAKVEDANRLIELAARDARAGERASAGDHGANREGLGRRCDGATHLLTCSPAHLLTCSCPERPLSGSRMGRPRHH